jgi:uncharacterized protein YbcC (UPF0753/DUF2309 family)
VHGLRYRLGDEPDLARRVAALRARLERLPRPPVAPPPPRRHRDALLAAGGPDTDEVVHPELVRLGAAFLDQGHAHASFPGREEGFFRAVARAVAAGGTLPRACRAAADDFREALARGLAPLDVIRAALAGLGVPDDDAHDVVLGTLLALPG